MLAQLLGIGRGKKDKENDKEKREAVAKDGRECGDAVAVGDIASTAAGQQPPTSATRAAPSPPAAVPLHREHAPFTGKATSVNGSQMEVQNRYLHQRQLREARELEDDDMSGCECCGRNHFDCDDEDELDTVVEGEDYDSNSDWDQGVPRSMVPTPPAAPAGASGSVANLLVPTQPLAPKAFTSEVGAVERGLHIQLGEVGAKTEAQLGEVQLDSAKRLRHLLASNKERIIQELLARGWVPLLLRWLGLVHRPNLQVEALWALINVAQNTTEHIQLLLKHGAVGTLVSLLKSPSLEVVEQAMWVLGNMAQEGQDGTAARDAVLQAGTLGPLVRCLEHHPSLVSLQRIGAWSLCNLFDGQPRPTIDSATVITVMPAINRLLRSPDAKVLSHTCSALSHLCDGSAAHIKVVVESGVCTRLVQLLDHHSWRVVKPALRTIGNVVCAEDDADYTETILEAGSVACLRKLIAHPNREIQKEACWTLSNIAAGSVGQIQSVLDSGAMPQLMKLATSADTESEVRSEAFWVVLNAASCGSDAQIEYLVSQGCVQILSDLLGESSMVMMALEGIERVLSVGDLRVVRNAISSHIHTDQGNGDGHEGEEAHCAECASVAAVGAAAAAAASGGVTGNDGVGGGALRADGTDGAYTNPYACLLAPEKIQALERHKNSEVAKRANRVWARYFVTCAICRRSFSRHGSSATFCTECKCHVCGSCDCTVFHLDYQDKLWQEMEGKEKKGKQAQQAAKKNKKAKKKEKKKLALIKEPAARDASPLPKGTGRVEKRGVKANGEDGIRKMSTGPAGKLQTDGRLAMEHRKQVLDEQEENDGRGGSPSGGKDKDKGSHSSSASTESNSEDEYTPSSPRRNLEYRSGIKRSGSTSARSVLAKTSNAAALIRATAAAVTAAGDAITSDAAANFSVGRGRRRNSEVESAIVTVAAATAAATLIAGESTNRPANSPSNRNKAEDGQRNKRAQSTQQQPARKTSVISTKNSDRIAGARNDSKSPDNATPSSASGKSLVYANLTAAGRSYSIDDENEEPWVVVGGKTGGGTGPAGGKITKRKKGQRERDGLGGSPGSAATAPAPPGGRAGSSVVEWASEARPAAVMSTVAPATVGASKVTAASGIGMAALAASAASSSRSGNPWGIAPTATASKVTAAVGQPAAAAVSASNLPTLAAANTTPRLRPPPATIWANGSTPTSQATTKPTSGGLSSWSAVVPVQTNGPPSRLGVGQGSVWRTSPPAPPAPSAQPGRNDATKVTPSPSKLPGSHFDKAPTAVGGRGVLPPTEAPPRAAGVIGRPQPTAVQSTVADMPLPPGVMAAFRPFGSSAAGSVTAGVNRAWYAPTTASLGHGGNGEIGQETRVDRGVLAGTSPLLSTVSPAATVMPSSVSAGLSKSTEQVTDGLIVKRREAANNGRSPTGGNGDGEALVENEKLVSFLMETGSILALAQRLEEEEDWRMTPTSAGTG